MVWMLTYCAPDRQNLYAATTAIAAVSVVEDRRAALIRLSLSG
jgi:hypothetical protein